MPRSDPRTIRFRGRTEPVIESFHVRGRTYFALEKLTSGEAYRVFDPHAGPEGDYRALHLVPKSRMTRNQLEVVRRLGGPTANRNFPGVVDFTPQRDVFVVVTAWVHGVNLKSYLSAVRAGETPRPTTREVVRLARGLAHGLAHYHRRSQLIHGDISPANIVVSAGTSSLVLIDFGSAWPVERTANRDADAYTQPYAAPERIAKHALEDFRADVFSHSAIAYEMLTLAVPYEGLGGRAGTPELVAKAGGSCRQPSAQLPDRGRLPQRAIRLLDDCVWTGLKLHPDERFSTSSDWLEAWDAVQQSLQKGSRLSGVERLFLAGFDKLLGLFQR